MFISDKIAAAFGTQRKITDEGFLLVPAKIARVGIYDYLAKEIDAPNRKPDEPMKVYRPSEQVFDAESVSSFALKPVTLNHPPEMLTIDNVKQYQVGHVGGQIVQDGDFLTTDMLITDKAAIKAIQDGQTEVSNGYNAEFDFISGYTPDGQIYDAIMKNIRGNHVAIVDVARGGRGCRIADNQTTGVPMKKIILDGVEFETSEEGATAIDQLQSQLAECKAKMEMLEGEIAKVTGESQAKVDEMGAQLAEAQSAVPTPEELDKIVEDRAALVNDAKAVLPSVETKGKTAIQIIESVVVKVCDGIDLSKFNDSQKEIYCRARFDALLSTAGKSINDGSQKINIDQKAINDAQNDPVESARQKRIKESETMYKLGK